MLKAIGNRVLVRPIIKKEASGIVVPDNAEKEKPACGEVLDAGECTKIKVGDKVIFRKYAPEEVEDGKETLLIIEETDVLCVMS